MKRIGEGVVIEQRRGSYTMMILIKKLRNQWSLIPLIPLLLIASLSACGNSFAQDIKSLPPKKLIPYIEAEGQSGFLKTAIGWISPDQLVFSSKDAPLRIEKLADRTIWHLDESYRISIFDVVTGKTSFYRNGLLGKYEDGVATIQLKWIRMEHTGTDLDDYEYRLKGPLGHEEPLTDYRKNRPTPLKRCFTDSQPYPPDNTTHEQLKVEHGCIESPNVFTREGAWTYFRNDGKKVVLDVPSKDDFGPAIWIPWLNAYLMGDSPTMSFGRRDEPRGSNNPTLRLLKPDGSVLAVAMNEWSLVHARPTRAGMIAHRYMPAFSKDYDGLYLWHEGQIVQITEGLVEAVEVSPDGCRVAYLWHWRSIKDIPSKLRVIDVCKGLGVSPDASPFVW